MEAVMFPIAAIVVSVAAGVIVGRLTSGIVGLNATLDFLRAENAEFVAQARRNLTTIADLREQNKFQAAAIAAFMKERAE